MKYLIMCEGPNELEIIRMLLEHDKLIFTEDDLLNLVPYHVRQIASNPTVKAALNLYVQNEKRKNLAKQDKSRH